MISIPGGRLEEFTVAFVVVRPRAHVTAADVVTWSREKSASYEVPNRVALVDDLPLNAPDRVMNDELRRGAEGD